VVVQRGCAKWSARIITNWLLILNTRAGGLVSVKNESAGKCVSGCALLISNDYNLKSSQAGGRPIIAAYIESSGTAGSE